MTDAAPKVPTGSRIRVTIDLCSTGLYVATSPDLSGFLISHPDRDVVERDVPNVIRMLLKYRLKQDVAVIRLEDDTALTDEWVSIPGHIIASATANA